MNNLLSSSFGPTARVAHRAAAVAALTVTAFAAAAASGEVLRIANWNMANRPNDAADQASLATILGHMGTLATGGGTARPFDVLAMAEMDSNSIGAVTSIAASTYATTTYTSVLTAADGGGDRTGFVYNSATLQLMNSVDLGNVSMTHNALRGHFRPIGTLGEADFHLYAVHLKSGTAIADKTLRLSEARVLRADVDALGTANVILAGDFNLHGSAELGAGVTSAWDALTASGGHGQLFDPVNRPGAWRDNAAFRDLHTNDPGGPMDDRFDLQLISGELTDGLGLDYRGGSYTVVGNNGTHALDGLLSTGTGAPVNVLGALAGLSDHLPVLADYTYSVTAVPEPGAAMLLVGGLFLMVRRQRGR